MGTTVEEVIIQLKVRAEEADRKLKALASDFDRNMGVIGNSATKMERRVGSVFAGLKAAALTFVSLQAVKSFTEIADESSRMTAKLQLASEGLGSFGAVQKDVNAIAAETRSEIGGVADLYGSLARSSKDLGANQEQVARATLTVSEALKVSGASTAEATSVTRQLAQALASGTLRGDEFNSIMENGPRLAKLLADSLDVPIGKLRSMAENGELTSDKLFKALNDRKFTAGLDAEFKRIPPTFDDAMTAVKNIAVAVFGGFDRGGRFSQSIASFGAEGSQDIQEIGEAAERTGADVRAAFETLTDIFDPLVTAAEAAFQQIGIKATSLRNEIASAFAVIDDIRNTPLQINQAIETALDTLTFGNAGLVVKDPTKYRRTKPVDTAGDYLRRAMEADRVREGEARDQALKSRFGPKNGAPVLPGLALAVANLPLDKIIADLERAPDLADNLTSATKRAGEAQKALTVDAKAMVSSLIEANWIALLRAEGRGQEADDVEALARVAQQVNLIDGLTLKQREQLLATMRDLTIEGARQVEFAQKRLDVEAGLQRQLGDRADARSSSVLDDASKKVNDELDAFRERGIQTQRLLADTFENLFTNGVGSVWDQFKRLGIRVIAEVLATLVLPDTLGGGLGGGNIGGLLTSTLGGLLGLGRASGGHVSAGMLYRVNELPGGVEGFRPSQSGTIIPLGQMSLLRSPAPAQSAIATVRLELSGDIDARIQSVSGPVAVQVVRASAPSLVEASVVETSRRFSRPKL